MKKLGIIFLVLFAFVAAFASEKGSISGIVVNEMGTPVPGAKVYVRDMHRASMKAVEYFDADQNGNFKISDLPFGEYRVSAKKEEQNYADTGWAFHGNHQSPVTVLSKQEPRSYVIVKLPPPAGVLQIVVMGGTSSDKLKNASLNLARVEDPKKFLSCSANTVFPTFIPSNVPVTVEVTAPGYPGELTMKRNETLRLDVRLQPDPNAGATTNQPQH